MNPKENDLLRWMYHNLIPSKHNGWKLFSQGQLLYLEYRITPQPRYGHGKPPHPQLHALFNRDRQSYHHTLYELSQHLPAMARIETETPDFCAPTFHSRFYTGIDALALYGFIHRYKPRRYVEIGSGNSTHFARLAIQDAGLQTTITCIDAHPRREIHTVADTVIEKYLEETDLTPLLDLEAGDVFFFDGSHRAFTNSDVTVFFLEILPMLKPGVIIHIHDIHLPSDYPERWSGRYYSEQYLLACWLLANSDLFEVLLPAQFLLQDEEFEAIIRRLWGDMGCGHLPHIGLSFWMTKKG